MNKKKLKKLLRKAVTRKTAYDDRDGFRKYRYEKFVRVSDIIDAFYEESKK